MWAEEWGFIGCMAVLFAYGLLVLWVLKIGRSRAPVNGGPRKPLAGHSQAAEGDGWRRQGSRLMLLRAGTRAPLR